MRKVGAQSFVGDSKSTVFFFNLIKKKTVNHS